MFHAIDIASGHRIEATPGARAACPGCAQPVTAKCGTITAWHWAHQVGTDCDPWAEPDRQWHLTWQQKFPAAMREVRVGNHRADIVTPGAILEVQHSNISADEIREREDFYGRMVWVFDAIEPHAAGRLDLRTKKDREPTWRSFRWKHPRKSLAACRRPVFLDLGAGSLLRLGRIYPTAPCGGWGHLVAADRFVAALMAGGAQ